MEKAFAAQKPLLNLKDLKEEKKKIKMLKSSQQLSLCPCRSLHKEAFKQLLLNFIWHKDSKDLGTGSYKQQKQE